MAEKNIFQRLFGTTVEQKQTGMVGYFGVGNSDNRMYKYQDLAKEGYLKNAIVYRCVNEISKGAASVPFMLKQGDEVLEDHPLINLLNRPNPLQSYSEFFNSMFGFLMLSGNSYILKVGGETISTPQELHLLRPDRMKVKGSTNSSMPSFYEYHINGKIQGIYDVDQENGFSEVKHVKLWNPLDDYYGCSPLSAAAVEVDQHNMSSKHNVNLLNNGARPSGAVVFKPKDEAGMSMNLTESQRQQLLTDLNNRFSGTSNAGRPLLLEGDFDWKEMGLSPKDMDFIKLKHMSATDIALCFGVPSQLVGVPDAQTYANVAEARLALYEETIIPHLKLIESEHNEWLVPQFGDDLMFCYDIDKIPALSERRRKVYENITSAVREGILTRNEAREQLGLSPIDGADDLYISGTLLPLTGEDIPEPEVPDKAEDVSEYTVDDDEDDFIDSLFEDKALADIDLTPTQGMVEEAEKGLEWRKEFGRGGTMVGVSRARDIVNGKRLSVSSVKRMKSFFARHEVDKQAEGFRQGEEGYPSAGRIAWALWGGDAGFSWSKKKVDQINAELEKFLQIEELCIMWSDEDFKSSFSIAETIEGKAPRKVSQRIKTALKNKADKHNDKYGSSKTKRTSVRTLEAVFRRGVGAYYTNPQSVRPGVSGPDQWGLARVNNFLRVLRTGRYKSGKHDTDLLPKGHPHSTK